MFRFVSAPAEAGTTREVLARQEPPMSIRDEVILLTRAAASVEHGVLVEYLYAAFSLIGSPAPADRWRDLLLVIAREEMAHFVALQNVLLSLGAPIEMRRREHELATFYPFPYSLAPFSRRTVARLALAEAPERSTLPPDVVALLPDLESDAELGQGLVQVNRIGLLYELLLDLMERMDPDEFRSDVQRQATAPEWAAQSGMIVSTVTSRDEAIALVRSIAQQGEGLEQPRIGDASHFIRLLDIWAQLRNQVAWQPTRQYADDPSRRGRRGTPLRDPLARAWATLFDTQYRILLATLAQAFTLGREAESRRSEVIAWCFEAMFRMTRINEQLSLQPTAAGSVLVAGPTFREPYSVDLPKHPGARWRFLRSLMDHDQLHIAAVRRAANADSPLLEALSAQDSSRRAWIDEVLRGEPDVPPEPPPPTGLLEIRLLPPLVIARFGSSPEPLENYAAALPPTAGFRELVPLPTFQLDEATGAIVGETSPDPDSSVHFRDAQGRIKPLAPFIEVWARFEADGPLEPLTLSALEALGLEPDDLEWSLEVANLKVHRRTGDPRDRVIARLGPISDHTPHAIEGRCDNFKPGKGIRFGEVRYLRPSLEWPEVRLRFTPGSGKVFGPRDNDPLTNDDVYAGFTAAPSPAGGYAGRWDRYWIGAPGTSPVTAPGDIFQGESVGDNKLSSGYLDDTCDGIVRVALRWRDQVMRAAARVVATVPDFAPDGFHVRTIADELEQMALGPDPEPPKNEAERQTLKREIEDILRRALETVRLTNTMVQNGDQNIGGVERYFNSNPGQQTGIGRAFEPVYPTGGAAQYEAALGVHKAVLARALESPTLEGSFGGQDRLRPPEEIGDLTDAGRRRMPTMMRGSDSLELALTRRQIGKLALAGEAPASAGRLAFTRSSSATSGSAAPKPPISLPRVSAPPVRWQFPRRGRP